MEETKVMDNVEELQAVEDEYNFFEDDGNVDDTDATIIESMNQAVGLSKYGANTDSVLKRVVEGYIESHRGLFKLDCLMENKMAKSKNEDGTVYWKPVCDKIRDDILCLYDQERTKINQRMQQGSLKLRGIDTLPGWVLARILIATGDVKVLNTARPDRPEDGSLRVVRRHYFCSYYTQGKYKWSGQWAIFQSMFQNDDLYRVARMLNPSLDRKTATEFADKLNDAPSVMMHGRKDIIFYRNGVWDYTSKQFTEYDDPRFDERYGDVICLCKFAVNHPYGKMWGGQKPLKVDADGNPIEPVCICHDGKEWRPSEQLMAPFELGTPEGDASYDCYLRFLQFTLRGTNGDPKFYHFWVNGNGDGTNGKGCAGDIIELQMINLEPVPHCEDLVVRPLVVPAAVDELDKDHKLGSNLLSAHLIRGQETKATSGYIENCAIMKDLARSQPRQYRDMYKMPIVIAYDGGCLQESNYSPLVSDKSVSTVRAVLVTKYNKHFGTEYGEIKSDFLRRQDVRSWIAWYVTTQLPFYQSYDKASTDILQGNASEMLKESMSTAQFFDEVLPLIPLDVIPWEVLFYMYERWCHRNAMNSKQIVTGPRFKRDMQQYANMPGSPVYYKTAPTRMDPKDYANSDVTDIPALRYYGFDAYQDSQQLDNKMSKYAINKVTSLPSIGNKAPILMKTLMKWTDFTIAAVDKNGNAKLKQMRNVFVRKVSHFVQPLPCETENWDENNDEDKDA